ncbi:hypothetical protein mRhiFer1_008660 [Rhinolophus ferrumequinum]|uniref:Uncharacterized protein n=1 Tax=Rhinolophus ferrumequinum TaxID=59479 RepID=A0A7J7U163_RHIFE|nr:hypothetical protein mRhiFer1_008660 [Rhinolophus ferrumequinum]
MSVNLPWAAHCSCAKLRALLRRHFSRRLQLPGCRTCHSVSHCFPVVRVVLWDLRVLPTLLCRLQHVWARRRRRRIRNLKPRAALELGIPFLFLFGYMTRKLLLVIASCAAPTQSEKEAVTL